MCCSGQSSFTSECSLTCRQFYPWPLKWFLYCSFRLVFLLIHAIRPTKILHPSKANARRWPNQKRAWLSTATAQRRRTFIQIMFLNTHQIFLLFTKVFLTEEYAKLTDCRMALLCRRDNISSAVNACSATSMHWMTWSCVDNQKYSHTLLTLTKKTWLSSFDK